MLFHTLLKLVPANVYLIAYRYEDVSMKELMKELHKINVKLKQYSAVNKKALDQYVSFSQQKEDLMGRKKELDDGAKVASLVLSGISAALI